MITYADLPMTVRPATRTWTRPGYGECRMKIALSTGNSKDVSMVIPLVGVVVGSLLAILTDALRRYAERDGLRVAAIGSSSNSMRSGPILARMPQRSTPAPTSSRRNRERLPGGVAH